MQLLEALHGRHHSIHASLQLALRVRRCPVRPLQRRAGDSGAAGPQQLGIWQRHVRPFSQLFC